MRQLLRQGERTRKQRLRRTDDDPTAVADKDSESGPEGQPQAPSRVAESTIEAPELTPAERSGGEQVDVRPAQPPSSEAVLIEKMQRFVVRREERAREPTQEIERRRAPAQRAARQFADDGGMGRHPTVFQEASKLRDTMPEVFDPH